MTWTVTVDSGGREIALPNGLRYQGAAQVVLSDDWYAQLSANALAVLVSGVSLGGIAAYTVTVASGVNGVVLPDGLRHKAGDVVVLSDEEYSILTPNAISALLSSVQVAVN